MMLQTSVLASAAVAASLALSCDPGAPAEPDETPPASGLEPSKPQERPVSDAKSKPAQAEPSAVAAAGVAPTPDPAGSAPSPRVPAELSTPPCIDREVYAACPPGTELRISRGQPRTAACNVSGRPLGSRPERQGPSLWFRDDGSLERAGRFDKHRKEGRWHYFYPDGSLEYIKEWKADKNTGPYVGCYPDGTVRQVVGFIDSQNHGLSRWWKKDGSLSYAFEYDHGKKVRQVEDPEELARLAAPPEGLCRPQRCTMEATGS